MTNHKSHSLNSLIVQAVEASREPLTIADARAKDFPLVFVNQAFEETTGYSREEVLGRNCRFLQGDDRDQAGLAVLRQALQDGQGCQVELRNYRKDGTLFINQLTISIIRDDAGEITHYLGSQRDITAQTRYKKDLESTRQQLANRVQRLVDVADMSATLANISDPKRLMQAIADLTKTRFDLYHAHIYLYDKENDQLHLSAGAGSVGRQMVSEKRSISAQAAQSLVARAFQTRQSVMVNDVRENPTFLPHPLLPDTRAELATPMIVGDHPIGVLDIQAAETDSFNEEDGVIMLTLASQMAIALDHATNLTQVEKAKRDLEESQDELQRALEELRILNRQMSQDGWAEFLKSDQKSNLIFEYSGIPDLQKTMRTTTRILPQIQHLDFPLEVGDFPLGHLDFEGVVEEEDEANILVREVLERLGSHMENLRLSEQTRQALSESNTLYEISTSLNRAQSLEDILQAIVQSMRLFDINGLSFWTVEFDRKGNPEWQILRESWRADDAPLMVSPGARFKIGEYQLNDFVFGNPPRMLLIGDVDSHALTVQDQNFAQFRKIQPVQAAAYMPLSSGNRLIGLITVHWDKARLFSDREVQFLETLSAQVAPAVESLNLLSEAQIRAELGGKLSNISAALSTARTEDEMVQAIVDILGFHNGDLSLSYILDAPLTADSRSEMVSQIFKGNPDGQPTDEEGIIKLGDRATSELWLDTPSDPVFIDDVASAPRVPKAVVSEALTMGWRSLAILPLFSSGRWQGILTIKFNNPHTFTTVEREVLLALVEPLGAVVASRRAQLAQLEAQKRAEFLYEVSRQLNEASSDLAQIIQVVSRLDSGGHLAGATLLLVDANEPAGRRLRPTAGHVGEDSIQAHQFETLLSTVSDLEVNQIREPIFVNDLTACPSPGSPLTESMVTINIRALGVLPLWVGDFQLGIIFLFGPAPYIFTEAEIQLYSALAPQIAVAVQNQTLLSGAQDRAKREQILREISEKVRRAPTVDMVLKTAASEVGRIFGRKALIHFNQEAAQTDLVTRDSQPAKPKTNDQEPITTS